MPPQHHRRVLNCRVRAVTHTHTHTQKGPQMLNELPATQLVHTNTSSELKLKLLFSIPHCRMRSIPVSMKSEDTNTHMCFILSFVRGNQRAERSVALRGKGVMVLRAVRKREAISQLHFCEKPQPTPRYKTHTYVGIYAVRECTDDMYLCA